MKYHRPHAVKPVMRPFLTSLLTVLGSLTPSILMAVGLSTSSCSFGNPSVSMSRILSHVCIAMRVYASRRMDAMNRLRAGMTQAELDRAIGTTQSHVSEYESGARRIETMPAGEFVRLKAVLDVTDALLLDADLSGIDPDAVAAAENRVARLRRRLRRRRDRASFDLLVEAELDLARRMDEREEAVARAMGSRA